MRNGGNAKRIRRIGVLSPVSEAAMRERWDAFRDSLARLGYVEGRDIELVWRFAEGRFERLPALAAELVALNVDVIMPATPPAILAARAVAKDIPIVFPLGSDPVETGLVASLERPGGNITGLATMSWLQCRPRMALVRELLPTARRLALMHHSANAALQLQVRESLAGADELEFDLGVLAYANAHGIADVFERASQARVEAMMTLSDPMASANAETIAALSVRHRMPVISPFRKITEGGGVLSYGPDLSMLFRRSATLVDQILKGAYPGDLPIGQPETFELAVNLKAARVLGLTVPAAMLSRADQVIQ